MPGQQPTHEFLPVEFGGPLNEALTPSRVGGGALTACLNLIYRRGRAWGKRSGSNTVFTPSAGGTGSYAMSGIRWYAATPSPRTQLVVSGQLANGNMTLYTGNDSGSLTPIAFNGYAAVDPASNTPPAFASVYDPIDGNGSGYPGSDVLVIAGMWDGSYSFAIGSVLISTVTTGDTCTLTFVGPGGTPTVVVGPYTVLPTDNPTSVALALVTLINDSAAVTGGNAFLGQAVATAVSNPGIATVGTPIITFGSLTAYKQGGATNQNTITFTPSGSGWATQLNPVAGHLEFFGAGPIPANTTSPIKWDGTAISGLGWQVQAAYQLITSGVYNINEVIGQKQHFAFTGCVTWHDHLWFWGDTKNPAQVYACDISSPETMSFMIENGGGYPIGEGDGDPYVQALVPIGSALYVFKSRSIWMFTGYDFQAGEYTFQLSPVVSGYGIPAPNCVAVLNNNLIFWGGTAFYRLSQGAVEPEPIGATIPLTSGKVANGNPSLMRTVSGSFAIKTLLTNDYAQDTLTAAQLVHSNVVLFACDVGNGVADTVLVYDDDASQALNDYAWSVFGGWEVAAWIPFGAGNNAAQTGYDVPTLYFVPPIGFQGTTAPTLQLYGGEPDRDRVNGIDTAVSFMARTGWTTLQVPGLRKELHAVYVEIEGVPGAAIAMNILADKWAPQDITLPSIAGEQTANESEPDYFASENFNCKQARVNPHLNSRGFMYTFTEGEIGTAYELVSLIEDVIVEAFKS